MTKFRATSIAVFLMLAALALGACGDDEGSKESATTGTEATTTTGTTETGTTETRERTDTTETRERTGTTNTRERTQDDKGGSGGGGGSDDSSGSGTKTNSDSSPEKQLTDENVFSTSKKVCRDFLPIQLTKELKEGKTSAEDIADDYSKGYPSKQRKRARDGCLAGIKAKDL
jgi:hypothetical protein